MPASTPPLDNFGQLQVGDLVYLNNVFGLSNNNTIADVGSMSWCVPCGAQTGFRCYDLPVAGSAEDTGECRLKWEVQDSIGATGFVRAYPSVLLGTLDGRDSSWGVFAKTGCNGTAILDPTGRCVNHPVYDMRDVRDATGFPMRFTEMPNNIKIAFELIQQCGGTGTGTSNGFIDTYFHNISDPSTWPSTYQAAWGDYNKINARATNAWNLNIWTCLPEPSNNPSMWLHGANNGGYVASRVLGGIPYDFYCKHEHAPNAWNNGCAGGFFYIGMVIPGQIYCDAPVCIDYAAVAQWIGSQDFKNTVLSHPIASQVYANVGSPDFIVDAPNDYLLTGIQAGKEIWFSDGPVESCLRGLQFVLGDEVYGKSTIQTLDECPRILQPRPWQVGQQLSYQGGLPAHTFTATGANAACRND